MNKLTNALLLATLTAGALTTQARADVYNRADACRTQFVLVGDNLDYSLCDLTVGTQIITDKSSYIVSDTIKTDKPNVDSERPVKENVPSEPREDKPLLPTTDKPVK